MSKVNIINRKAKFEYSFLEKNEAGIMLTGTEIKSLRQGQANMTDAYCVFMNNDELYIKNLHIAEYEQGTYNNHITKRTRKLLMKRRELTKWKKRVTEKGMSIVPYRIYISEKGLAKVELALSQGKKSYDKRASIKERDVKRDLDRMKLR